jgi:predicted transcriptional regulator
VKTGKKSLQKLTDLEVVNKVIAKEKITRQDYSHFTKAQVALLNEELNKIASSLKTAEVKDAFFNKLGDIIDIESRNIRWQSNHVSVQAAIANLLSEYNRMPSVLEIAQEAKLSRQTVNKHLKNFDTQELYKEEWNKLKYSAVNVAGKVMKEAMKGNMKAARLFFDLINNDPMQANTYVKNQIKNQQNNYLTIDNVKLDEATLKSMPAELLQQIEEFVKIKRKNSENK